MSNNGKPTGIVNIKGKDYETVALRIKKFRDNEKFKDWSLATEIVVRDAAWVVVRASIMDAQGHVRATGHAEENRESSQINSTSALENCETSAIGRCLAALGLGGTEFASADEVAQAIHQQAAPRGSARAVTEDAFKSLPKERQDVIRDTAVEVVAHLEASRDFDAYSLCESLDTEGKLAIWSLLDSKARSRIKAAKAQELATQA